MSRQTDLYKDVNKVTLVPGTATTGKRGKGAGFYCEPCNLTFKDSIQYVDHVNSKQHLQHTGESEIPPRATLQQVKDRINLLYRQKKASQANVNYDIKQHIRAIEEKRRQKRQKVKKHDLNHHRSGSPADTEMMAAMGFSGFGSSKH